ncbi:MAG: hypothetical protein PHO79_03240 [Desulfoplanes sp.]|nr:hypothetical protein [Desulfoplanes sp.]
MRTNINAHIIFLAVLLAIALMVGCAGPQGYSGHSGSGGGGKDQPPTKEELLTEYDKDHDGRLSKAEFPGPDEHFSLLDTNSDGYLEADELPDGPPKRGRRG